MTSLISSTSLATVQSPRTQMNARIASAVSTGEISSTDQSALSTALDSIDQSLASSKTGSGKGGMKDKIDSLIDGQVDGGTLTADQASELKAFFAQGAGGAQQASTGSDDTGSDDTSTGDTDDMAISASKGPGGPRGPGGPPPPRSSDDDDSDSDTSTSSSSSTATASTDLSDQLKALETMLDNLRKSLASSANTYGGGSSSTPQTGLVYQSVA